MATNPYADLYKTMPMPGVMTGGDKTTAASGVVTPPPPPSVNTAPVGAPAQPKLPDLAVQHGAVAPTIGAKPAASTTPAPMAPAAPSASPNPAPAGPPPAAFGSDTEGRINTYLQKIMSGEGTPFNPAVMGKLRGRLFAAANGQADTAINQAKDDAVKRGMFRSGLPTDAILAARAAAGQNYTKGEADLESQAANANNQSSMQAVQDLIAQLQNSRQFDVQNRQLAQSAPRGPDYNAQLLQLMGSLDEPTFQ